MTTRAGRRSTRGAIAWCAIARARGHARARLDGSGDDGGAGLARPTTSLAAVEDAGLRRRCRSRATGDRPRDARRRVQVRRLHPATRGAVGADASAGIAGDSAGFPVRGRSRALARNGRTPLDDSAGDRRPGRARAGRHARGGCDCRGAGDAPSEATGGRVTIAACPTRTLPHPSKRTSPAGSSGPASPSRGR